MARKTAPSPQLGLGLSVPKVKEPEPIELEEDDSFDDDPELMHDPIHVDIPVARPAHSFRIVHTPRSSPSVIVEAVGDRFEVSRLRDNGSTVACVVWTKSELEELRIRIDAALSMVGGQ